MKDLGGGGGGGGCGVAFGGIGGANEDGMGSSSNDDEFVTMEHSECVEGLENCADGVATDVTAGGVSDVEVNSNRSRSSEFDVFRVSAESPSDVTIG